MHKYNKRRSLKNRISSMVSMVNFYSLLILLISMIAVFGLFINITSSIISQNAARQMSFQLEDQLRMAISSGRISSDYNGKTVEYTDMFRNLGSSYVTPFSLQGPIHIVSTDNSDSPIPKGNPFLTVAYEIFKDDKLIYSSGQENNIDNALLDHLDIPTKININDDTGTLIYTLTVKLNPNIIFYGYIALMLICILIFLVTLLISRAAIRMLSHVVIKPITDLDKKIQELSDGNIQAAINTEIILKKPINEVESLANHTNKIMAMMHDYVDTLASQNQELEAQNITLNENSKTLEFINQKLDNKNSKLKNIFNNVEEGFLTFKDDLIIHGEYSLECERIFNNHIGGETLSTLIYPQSPNMKGFVDELLLKIFYSDKDQRKLYMPLLPDEVAINNKIVSISYKVVKDVKEDDTIMVIITDITEKRELKKQMQEEQNTLKMVVKAMINREDFLDLVGEYQHFAQKSFMETPEGKSDEIKRQIHTFKGNFSQYEMISLVANLDELETKLYEETDPFEVKNIDNEQLNSWLKKDLDIIKTYAGNDFMDEGKFCYVKKDILKEIEGKVQSTLLPREYRQIMPLVRSLRYKPIKELLKTYPDYVMKLSERIGKTISPMSIQGDDIMVDGNYYQGLVKSLVHVFRNSVDHGIETEDERLEQNKEQIGNISCQVRDLGDTFQIIIGDDGKGINIKAIEEKVLEKGMFSREELDCMSLKEKRELIFLQGITTKEKATYISGRGVGMPAVREVVLSYGGTIQAESEEGKGTTLIISLEKQKELERPYLVAKDFLKELGKNAADIINRQTGLKLKSRDVDERKIIALEKVTALVSLSGTFNSILIISGNENIVKKMVQGFMLENIDEEEKVNYSEDVLAEMTNTIIGTSLGKFENTDYIFHMGVPAVLSSCEACIRNIQSEIVTCKLWDEDFELNLSMLFVNSKEEYNG